MLLLDCQYITKEGKIEQASLMEFAVPNATPENVLTIAAQMMRIDNEKNNCNAVVVVADNAVTCYDYDNGIFVYRFNGGSM